MKGWREKEVVVHQERMERKRGSGASRKGGEKKRYWCIKKGCREKERVVHQERMERKRGSGASRKDGEKKR
jgi:hypothetical protein